MITERVLDDRHASSRRRMDDRQASSLRRMEDRHTSSIRRITEGGLRWRVMVETWQESDTYHGRVLFRREASDPAESDTDRETALLLRGRSRTDVLALAHDVSEERLRQVLHSLG